MSVWEDELDDATSEDGFDRFADGRPEGQTTWGVDSFGVPLEDAPSEPAPLKCCKYDHNNDGNCHIHSAPGVLRNSALAPAPRDDITGVSFPRSEPAPRAEPADETSVICRQCGDPMSPTPAEQRLHTEAQFRAVLNEYRRLTASGQRTQATLDEARESLVSMYAAVLSSLAEARRERDELLDELVAVRQLSDRQTDEAVKLRAEVRELRETALTREEAWVVLQLFDPAALDDPTVEMITAREKLSRIAAGTPE